MEKLSNNSVMTEQSFVEKVIRSRKFWFILIILSWLVSFSWLGEATFLAAPMLFLIYIKGLLYVVYHNYEQTFLTKDVLFGLNFMMVLPVILDIYFILFIIFIKKISNNLLYFLTLFFILILALSLVGCSQMNYGF